MLESDIVAAKGGKAKAKGAIKAAQKKRKLADGDDTDVSDDFKPTKIAAKPKAIPKPKIPTKVSPAKRVK